MSFVADVLIVFALIALAMILYEWDRYDRGL